MDCHVVFMPSLPINERFLTKSALKLLLSHCHNYMKTSMKTQVMLVSVLLITEHFLAQAAFINSFLRILTYLQLLKFGF